MLTVAGSLRHLKVCIDPLVGTVCLLGYVFGPFKKARCGLLLQNVPLFTVGSFSIAGVDSFVEALSFRKCS